MLQYPLNLQLLSVMVDISTLKTENQRFFGLEIPQRAKGQTESRQTNNYSPLPEKF